MEEQALLSAIGRMMDEKLTQFKDEMNERFDKVEERLEKLEEDSVITREGVNTLLEWAEEAQVEIKIPLYKKAE